MTARPAPDLPEIADVRRRLLLLIDRVKRDLAERRAAIDEAQARFPAFLDDVAAPVFRQVAQVLKSEGFSFSVFTPAASVRLVAERTAEDFLAIELDTQSRDVGAVGRVSYSRGRRVLTRERPLAEGKTVAQLTGEDVLAFLIEELPPFLGR